MFELFNRLNTKENACGNGIGLSHARSVMLNYNGFILSA